MSIMPEYEKFQDFMDYLTENYIVFEAKFPISMWVEMTSSSEKTTNACESFHAKFNSFFFYNQHLDIYTFLKILKKHSI